MDNDDLPVGRVLSRREALKLLGGVSIAALVGCRASNTTQIATPTAASSAAITPRATATIAAPANSVATVTGEATAASSVPATATPIAELAATTCVVRPEMTEGPYFVDEKLNRSDIRTDTKTGTMSQGAPLLLAFNVSQIADGLCTPLPGAAVDVWHCDAAGVYSEFQSGAGANFLRGYQETADNGQAVFTTVYPGWYQGRTVHIHFKIRVPNGGYTYDFTSQLFFEDAFTDVVYQQSPYNQRPSRSTLNANDGIYRDGGEQLVVAVGEQNGQYVSAFDIALDLS